MGIQIIYKLAGIGILTAIVNQILKLSGKEEIATLTTLAGVIVALVEILEMIKNLFSAVNSIFSF